MLVLQQSLPRAPHCCRCKALQQQLQTSRLSMRLHSSQAGDAAAVPATWSEANYVFLSHPSAAVPVLGIVGVAATRIQQQPVTLLDLAVAAGVVALWLIQEWVVHKWLLHSSFEWAGKTIHMHHHQQPYHHISLDPPQLVIGVMLLAAGVFALLLHPFGSLWLTATAAYWAAGLVYEWLHYIVHTRWVPPAGLGGQWLREVRRHHMLHHMRNEDYWLSFSAPWVDSLFGTLPAQGTSVPLTDMAKMAHGSAAAAAAAAAGHGSSSGSKMATVGGSAAADQVQRGAIGQASSTKHSSTLAGAGTGAAASAAAAPAAQRGR